MAKDVFAVEIRDSDPAESEHYQTEDCNTTKTLAGIGKRSFPDSGPEEQTAEVISCQVTSQTVHSDVFDKNKERLHSLNECEEDQSETNFVGQSNRRNRPNSRIAIFDLHQMTYDSTFTSMLPSNLRRICTGILLRAFLISHTGCKLFYAS